MNLRRVGVFGVAVAMLSASIIVISSPLPVAAASSPVQPIEPARLVDTRPGEKTSDGEYAGIGRRRPRSITEIQVAGRLGVPADAKAAFINLTSIIPWGTNYLTAFPCGDVPNVSNLNSPPDDIRANGVFVRLSDTGTVCVYTVASTHFIIDIGGYVPAGDSAVGLTPARLFESRPGESTIDGQYNAVGRRGAKSVTEIQVAGRGGVPVDATAVFVNLTSIIPDATNFLTVYPCGALPTVSSLNTPPDDIRANGAFVRLSERGTICVYTVAATDFILDVNGYVPIGSTVTGLTPARLFESRPGEVTIDGKDAGVGRRNTDTITEIQIAGRAGVPSDATAVFINLTSVIPRGTNALKAFPCGAVPVVSNLNTPPDDIRANNAFVKLSAAGTICIYTYDATDLIVDVTGYIQAPPPSERCTIRGTIIATSLTGGECVALADLYASTGGPGWRNHDGWMTKSDPCTWTGVNCNGGHVTYLDLVQNQLIGPVPPTIRYLAWLEVLDLDANAVTSIPPEIGQLNNARWISLENNVIRTVPAEIGNLSRLRTLSVGSNPLGQLPDSIANLQNLRDLWASSTSLRSVPPGVFKIAGLQSLLLSDNQIDQVPAEIGNLTNLQVLALGKNQLTQLPEQIGNLGKLRSLFLYDNAITGLPPTFGRLISLDWLDLANNRIGGDITTAFAPLKSADMLTYLDLGGNDCPTTSDSSLATWLDNLGSNWRNGC